MVSSYNPAPVWLGCWSSKLGLPWWLFNNDGYQASVSPVASWEENFLQFSINCPCLSYSGEFLLMPHLQDCKFLQPLDENKSLILTLSIKNLQSSWMVILQVFFLSGSGKRIAEYIRRIAILQILILTVRILQHQ